MPLGVGGHRCDSKAPSSALTWHAEKSEKMRVLSTCSGAVGPAKEGQENTLQAHIPMWLPQHTIIVLVGAPAGAAAAHICSLPSLLPVLSRSWRMEEC